jgi:hypothetical protein
MVLKKIYIELRHNRDELLTENVFHTLQVSSLESPYKTKVHFFPEASHGNHGHIKEITDAFTISQIEEIIFLTRWRTQSHQWTKH